MNAVAMTFSNDTAGAARNASAAMTMGLGPNQLNWLRRNISPFKQAEEQRRLMRQDVVRAARIAGLI